MTTNPNAGNTSVNRKSIKKMAENAEYTGRLEKRARRLMREEKDNKIKPEADAGPVVTD